MRGWRDVRRGLRICPADADRWRYNRKVDFYNMSLKDRDVTDELAFKIRERYRNAVVEQPVEVLGQPLRLDHAEPAGCR